MQKIVPNLWFDTQAKESTEFYTSIFPDGKIISKVTLRNTPSGDSEFLTFTLAGYEFMSISAGPYFKINPSVSFMLNFDPSQNANAEADLNSMWEKLSDGGKVLMEINEYPFSKRYGWVEDKYGVSWQLILTNPNGEPRPFIVPSIMFVKDMFGKAEEATNFYIETFKNTKRGTLAKYPAEMGPDTAGKVMFTDFQIEGQWFAAMDGAGPHDFKFNEAVSLVVNCDSQEEIDFYWEQLSAVPESEQCGWLKDKFGLSWQVSPTAMNKMMTKGSQEQIDRITQVLLPMKKIEMAKIQEAYDNKS